MRTSPYFSELMKSYNDEIDDLTTDSSGQAVLQKRLNDKRQGLDAILPMIEFSTEMVAVVFYDAFDFKSPALMQQIAQSEPDDSDFVEWEALRSELTVADWAEPLIAATLKVRGGDAFLVTTAALEYLRMKTPAYAFEPELSEGREPGNEDDESEADDLSEAGADWLAEQGFETLER